MAVKDWVPVAQDIYDALIADGNPNQGKTLKISHKDLCEILDKHNFVVTEAMNKRVDMLDESFLVGIIRTTVRDKDLSKSLYDNGLLKGALTDAEERSAYSSHNVSESLWVYQIAHKLQFAFKNPKAKEEAIKDDEEIIENEIKVSEEKENTNENMGFVETEENSEDSFESTKHDKYIKICSEIVEIRRKLGAISILDLSTIVGKEFFSNGAISFTVPGDKRYIKVLEILNNISSIVNALSLGISLEELADHVEDQFNELDEIAESFKNSNKDADDKQLFSVLEYLDSIRKANRLKPIGVGTNDLLKAFVIGKIVDNESEFIFLSDNISSRLMMQLCGLINAPNFDINDEVQIDTCKLLISTIKQAVLRNKAANKIGCFVDAGKPFPLPPLPGIDQRIYQKAAAYDKITEALKPFFIELMAQSKGFGFPSANGYGLGGWGSPLGGTSHV